MPARWYGKLLPLLLIGLAAGANAGAPPGRSWTVPSRIVDLPPKNDRPVLRKDAAGRPALMVVEHTDPPRFVLLGWRDSSWVDSLSSIPGAGFWSRPVPGTDGTESFLALAQRDLNGYSRLVLWSADLAAPPETIAVTTDQLSPFAYAAAITPTRRWAMRIDQFPNQPWRTRTFVSTHDGPWQLAPVLSEADMNTIPTHCAVAPDGDSTALVVIANEWRHLNGFEWTAPQPFARRVEGPSFIARPAGGWWLVSSDRLRVHVDAWKDNAWSEEAGLLAAREPEDRGFVHVGWVEPALEPGVRPAIAWQENWGTPGRWWSAAHIAWPEPQGWSVGYQVPGSDSMFVGPAVMLDRNGDGWLAWWTSRDEMIWTHTYVTATTGTPATTGSIEGTWIEWELSHEAPGTWWAVLREQAGVFQEVARVQAGAGVEMAWLDSNAPSAPTRYRIRRESVDARYSWVSEPATFTPTSVPPFPNDRELRLVALVNPVRGRASLELLGAAPGTALLRVYDGAGREVARTVATAAGQGRDAASIDLAGRASGMYFVTARDAGGRNTPALRLVLLP